MDDYTCSACGLSADEVDLDRDSSGDYWCPACYEARFGTDDQPDGILQKIDRAK